MINAVADGIARGLGRALGPVSGVVAHARGARSLHPRGTVLPGRLRRVPGPVVGVDWLDDDLDVDVVVRLSRSAGLPPPLPDVFGLALRIPLRHSGHGDLLLSSSASIRVARHVLVPRLGPWSTAYTSLVPFSTGVGPLLVGALPTGAPAFVLAHAAPGAAWRPFGRLDLDPPGGGGDGDDDDDERLALDPVLHPLPGLAVPRALRLLREPAYRASRAARAIPGVDRDGSAV